jgi:adenylyltransferase/sulfurtransferase
MTIGPTIHLESEDRFHRFRQIGWWEQSKLESARILVIGAGALGNEVLKNLALLGVRSIFVADLDVIEESNLSRSILFRDSDIGRSKAETAASAVRRIYPAVHTAYLHGDAMFDLGLGVFRWADVVIAGLDNREARLRVNRCCQKLKKVWVDGATEVLEGVVRVFAPDGPCYECTLSADDFQLLRERRGCAGLRLESTGDLVPTTPVTASVIGALQVQEALKLLHGIPGLAGRGMVFNGVINDVYTVAYQRGEDCAGHDVLTRVTPINESSATFTARELLEEGAEMLGSGAQIDLDHELLLSLECVVCGVDEPIFRPMGSVPERIATCPQCGAERRPKTTQSIVPGDSFADRPLKDLGFPPFDIVTVRREMDSIGFELSADKDSVLGSLL